MLYAFNGACARNDLLIKVYLQQGQPQKGS